MQVVAAAAAAAAAAVGKGGCMWRPLPPDSLSNERNALEVCTQPPTAFGITRGFSPNYNSP